MGNHKSLSAAAAATAHAAWRAAETARHIENQIAAAVDACASASASVAAYITAKHAEEKARERFALLGKAAYTGATCANAAYVAACADETHAASVAFEAQDRAEAAIAAAAELSAAAAAKFYTLFVAATVKRDAAEACEFKAHKAVESSAQTPSNGGGLPADLLGAIARGWCHPRNAGKTLDPELAEAIAREVAEFFTHGRRV